MFGVGYSYNVWNKFYIDPSYILSLKENDDGERDGEFRLGISYKF